MRLETYQIAEKDISQIKLTGTFIDYFLKPNFFASIHILQR